MKKFSSYAVEFFVAVAIASLFACAPAAEEPLPNIVLLISDDHAWSDYGFMGHPEVKTPSLDQLASESMVYARGYVPTSVCRPSLATIATGLYPHQHGITGNDPPGGPGVVRDPVGRARMVEVFQRNQTLPELLGERGYVSLETGKWWEGDPKNHGFTDAMTHGDVSRGGRHGDDGLTIGREGMQPIYDFVDTAVAEDNPFFLWYAPFLPHTPHNPPDRLVESYEASGLHPEVAKYYAMIEWFDETVGQLLEHLDETGVRDNTLVLYVGDNGWLQAEDTQVQGLTPGKMSPYDAGSRTPIMMRWPGKVEPGRDEQTLVSSIDFAPTVLRALGMEPLPAMPGLDLRDPEALGNRTELFGALFAHTAVDIDNPEANLKYRTIVREDGWKLILPHAPNRDVLLTINGVVGDWARLEPELFNLTEDPHETTDLATERPELVEELGAALDSWWSVSQ